jgi:hypothetical protein
VGEDQTEREDSPAASFLDRDPLDKMAQLGSSSGVPFYNLYTWELNHGQTTWDKK